jgi:hypothetical protein
MTDIAYVREDAEDCVRQYLSFLPPKALNRITKSIQMPRSKLLSFLASTMYDSDKKTYLPLTSEPWIPGYNHEQTFELIHRWCRKRVKMDGTTRRQVSVS